MAPPRSVLYRILLLSCKELFLPENRVFFQSALDCVSKSIISLPNGLELLKKLPSNPRFELKRAFREGGTADLNVYFSVLPTILRFARAAALMEKQFPGPGGPTKQSKSVVSFQSKDDTQMLVGATLISKLHYQEKILRERNVEQIVSKGVDELAVIFKEELETLLLIAKKRNKTAHKARLRTTSEDKQRLLVLPVIKAFHATSLRWESRRVKALQGGYESLIDQVLQPGALYTRGVSTTYSVLFCAVLDALPQLHVQGVGICFPKDFKTRVVVKGDQKNSEVTSPSFQKYSIVSRRRNRGRLRGQQNHVAPREVNFLQLVGSWVGHYARGIQETRLVFNQKSRMLEARKVDGDQFIPSGKLAWKIDLSAVCKSSNMLLTDIPYPCEVQIAQRGFANACFVPYTLTIKTLPAVIFQPEISISGVYSNSPYFELVLEPAHTLSVDHSAGIGGPVVHAAGEANSTSVHMRVATGGAPAGGVDGQQVHRSPNTTTIARTHTGRDTHPALFTTSSNSNSSNNSNIYTNSSISDSGGGSSSNSSSSSSSSDFNSNKRSMRRGEAGEKSSRRGGSRSVRAGGQQVANLAEHLAVTNTPEQLHTGQENSAKDSWKENRAVSAANAANASSLFPSHHPAVHAYAATAGAEDWQPIETLRFCRVEDMDRCLLDISDLGVRSITPGTYLQLALGSHYDTTDLPRLLNPATAYAVVLRMAHNLWRSSAIKKEQHHEEDGVLKKQLREDEAFWSAVHKSFKYRLEQADRSYCTS